MSSQGEQKEPWTGVTGLGSCPSSGITVQFSSVTQSCPTLCDPMNCSMPGLPVHHQLPELTQTQVHQVGDAIQPSHPLLSPSPPTPSPSQHPGLFQCCYLFHVARREGTETRNLITAQQAADCQHQACIRPPPVSPEQPRWPNLEEHLSLSLGNHCFYSKQTCFLSRRRQYLDSQCYQLHKQP